MTHYATETEVYATIKRILSERLDVAPESLADCTAETSLLGKGVGLDSVEAMRLAAGVEESFGFQIEDEDLTPDLFRTFGTLADYVMRRKREQE